MKNILTVIILFLSIVAFSQKNVLGKVTIEELQEKVCLMDTSAVAAVYLVLEKQLIIILKIMVLN